MIQNLRRGVLAALAVAGVFAAILVVLALLMEVCWTVSDFGKNHQYDLVLRFGFQAYLLIIWTGFLSSFALRAVRVRWIGAYVLTGMLSGPLFLYALLFAMHRGIPLAFCCLERPSVSKLVLGVFRDNPRMVSEFVDLNGLPSLLAFCVPGFFLGLLSWRLLRPKPQL